MFMKFRDASKNAFLQCYFILVKKSVKNGYIPGVV